MEHVYVQIIRFMSHDYVTRVKSARMYGQKTCDRKRECELSLTYTNVFSYTDLELVLGGVSGLLLLKKWVISRKGLIFQTEHNYEKGSS